MARRGRRTPAAVDQRLQSERRSGAEDISVEYAVSGYPTKVIIGPDGLIIGKYAGEGPDFYEALHKTIQ